VSTKVSFTANRVGSFECPPGKHQAFIWDAKTQGLGLRVMPTGARSYFHQGRLGGSRGPSVRTTIGSPTAWSLADARDRARELQRLLDAGIDPREANAERVDQEKKKRAARKAAEITFCKAWARYLEANRGCWGDRHYADHLAMIAEGGLPRSRSKSRTVAGPLAGFIGVRLSAIDAVTLKDWAEREKCRRPARARLAQRQLKAFFNWCAEQTDLRSLIVENPAKAKVVRKTLGKASRGNDTVLRQQISAWFEAVGSIPNRAISAYLQTLLLTGARPGEVLALEWSDVDAEGKPPTLTLADKNARRDREDSPTRTIPLTPYVEHLLRRLPKAEGSPYVFASSVKKGSPISIPTAVHADACRRAGIRHVTLKGLRASFKSLTEWRGAGDLDVSPGLVGQIMGHRPRQTAEAHYTQRPLDMLAAAHFQIEAWILHEADVQFDYSIT